MISIKKHDELSSGPVHLYFIFPMINRCTDLRINVLKLTVQSFHKSFPYPPALLPCYRKIWNTLPNPQLDAYSSLWTWQCISKFPIILSQMLYSRILVKSCARGKIINGQPGKFPVSLFNFLWAYLSPTETSYSHWCTCFYSSKTQRAACLAWWLTMLIWFESSIHFLSWR